MDNHYEVQRYGITDTLDAMCRDLGYESYADLRARNEAALAKLDPEVREAVEDHRKQFSDQLMHGYSVTGPDGRRVDPRDIRWE